MIKVNKYRARMFTSIIRWKKIHYWDLYNPETKQILRRTDLHALGIHPFNRGEKAVNDYGVVDLTGSDYEHTLLWMQHLETYFKEGWILCAANRTPLLLCDGARLGFEYDPEKKQVVPMDEDMQ